MNSLSLLSDPILDCTNVRGDRRVYDSVITTMHKSVRTATPSVLTLSLMTVLPVVRSVLALGESLRRLSVREAWILDITCAVVSHQTPPLDFVF
jgi:hypothetical protein